MEWVIGSLGLIFLTALLAPVLIAHQRRVGLALCLAAPWLAFTALVCCKGAVVAGEFPERAVPWVPSLGMEWAFRVDGLSALMGLLITGIGGLIVPYARGYMGDHPQFNRFLAYLLFFMGSMLGLVLADNLILLFIFWEMTSISSYLLIGFKHGDETSRKKALQALLVTGLGGLALMAGFIFLGNIGQTWRVSELVTLNAVLTGSDLYAPMVILILIGAFTKSAQFPFHFWLPNAMAGPTPVSAFLHSATMVKAGIYLLARLAPGLSGPDLWHVSLIVFGGVTMLLAAGLGLLQTDLKRILAYTTVSVLGILTLLIGLGTKYMIQAAVLFLLGHALYKAALFMVAGSVDHATGSRDVRVLRGLRRAMPWTAGAALLAAFSKSGFPPFLGFLGKEYTYKASLAMPEAVGVIVGAVLITNALLLALAFKVGVHPFWGKRTSDHPPLPHAPHEVSAWMLAGPVVLALCSLAFGLMPSVIEFVLLEPAVSAIIGKPVELEIALWTGLNLPLLLSGITVAVGLTVFSVRGKIWERFSFGAEPQPAGVESLYHGILAGVLSVSRWQTRILQGGKLRNYLLVTIGSTLLLVAIKLFAIGGLPAGIDLAGLSIHKVILLGVMTVALIVAVTAPSRLQAILALGVVGFGIALLFAFFSAPDLAITQVLVETLIVVLFMFVISRLPPLRMFSKKSTRIADAFFSLGVGAIMTVVVLKAQNLNLEPSIAGNFAEASYLEAKGRNVVNVILVDFRALDTFGEITVLAIAALGVVALIRNQSDREDAP